MPSHKSMLFFICKCLPSAEILNISSRQDTLGFFFFVLFFGFSRFPKLWHLSCTNRSLERIRMWLLPVLWRIAPEKKSPWRNLHWAVSAKLLHVQFQIYATGYSVGSGKMLKWEARSLSSIHAKSSSTVFKPCSWSCCVTMIKEVNLEATHEHTYVRA